MVTRRIKTIISAQDRSSSVVKNVQGALLAFSAAFAAIVVTKVIRGTAQMVQSALSIGAAFDQSLSKVKALIQPTAGQFARLEEAAREMGKTTVFSAGQAAGAMEAFALAGFKTDEIIGALPDTLNLAAAGELEMSEAAEIAATAMKTFGIATEDLNEVVDSLVFTASNSNQSVRDVAEAFKFVAPAAKVVGADINNINASLAFFADRGLKASIAGTGFRKTLATLVGELDEGAKGVGNLDLELRDATGAMLPMSNIVGQLTAAGVKATDAYAIFGQRAGNLMALALEEGSEALKAYEDRMLSMAGVADQVARDKLNNLRGDMTLFKSATSETAVILFRQLEPALRSITQLATKVVNAFNDAVGESDFLKDAVLTLSGIVVRSSLAFVQWAGAIFTALNSIGLLDLGIAKTKQALAGFGILFLATIGKTPDEIRQIMRGTVDELEAGAQEMDGVFGAIQTGLLETLKLIENFESSARGIADSTAFFLPGDIAGPTLPLTPEIEPGAFDLDEALAGPTLALAGRNLFPVKIDPVVESDAMAEFNEQLNADLAALQANVEIEFAGGWRQDLLLLEDGTTSLVFYQKELAKISELEVRRNQTLEDALVATGKQKTQAIEILAAWEAAQPILEAQPELVGAFADRLLAAGNSITENLNPELEVLLKHLQEVADTAKGVPQSFLDMQSAVTILAVEGVAALQDELDSTNSKIESLGQAIRTQVGQIGVQAVGQFSRTLVDAAFDGEAAFDEFFKSLLKNIAAAIIQALLLQAILTAVRFAAPASAAGGAGAGGGAVFAAAAGGIVPGSDIGRDTVLMKMRPGELVLPPDVAREVLALSAGRVDEQGATVHIGGIGIQEFAEDVSDLANRRQVRLVATDVVS